ncbi:YdcF family protein [Candidatus Magnetomonas plexicatena]|uniref:YdcF family protein n=1 Tax=Candidatus Magnetomonas plexicatena TaxID=2552947 RepID=UPI001C74A713|nr:YdcF family protein [Nitrospirales bacterium LBB_01]
MRNIALVLINPLIYLAAGLVFLTLTRKHRRVFAGILALAFYLVLSPVASSLFLRFWAVPDTYNPKTEYDAVVVLSGAINLEWHTREQIGMAGENLYIPLNYVRTTLQTDRILAGIYFVRTGHAKKLFLGDWVVTNSNGTASEGSIMSKRYLAQALDGRDFELYGEVKRTVDEAQKMMKIAEDKKLKKILLVTSQSHMRRALAMFKKQGLNPDTFSVNKRRFSFFFKDMVPIAQGATYTYECLYELSGYGVYMLLGKL